MRLVALAAEQEGIELDLDVLAANLARPQP
jgi:hypothetical protein